MRFLLSLILSNFDQHWFCQLGLYFDLVAQIPSSNCPFCRWILIKIILSLQHELSDNNWIWPILSFLPRDIRPNLVQLHTLEIPNAKLGITWILDFINELKFQQLQPLNMIKSPTVRLISLCQCWQQTQIVNSAWEIYYFHLCKYTLHREHQSNCI